MAAGVLNCMAVSAASIWLWDYLWGGEDEQARRRYRKSFAVPARSSERLKAAAVEWADCVRPVRHPDLPYRPTHVWLKGLPIQKIYTPSECPWVEVLETNFEVIREEYLSVVGATELDTISSSNSGGWNSFWLIRQGQRIESNMAQVPRTAALLDSLHEVMSDCGFGYVYFSVIQPGTRIFPHTGPTNLRIRTQLGLVIPKCPVVITVGGEEFTWEEGKCLTFDDNFVHEVRHEGGAEDGPRVVLLVDVWHPDLTEDERTAVARVFPPSTSFAT